MKEVFGGFKMNYFENIGDNIQKILSSINMTQSELADRIGVSKQVMTKIVKGQKAINAYEIKSISSALGISLDDLVKERTYDDYSEVEPVLMFMGKIHNEETREKLKFLNSIIIDMVKMEEILNEE